MKLTTFQMFKGIVAVPDECVLSISEAYRMSSEITGKSWQRLWDNESTDRYTYDLIPVVNTKVTFSKVRDIIALPNVKYMTRCLKKTAIVHALLTLRYVNVDKQMNQLNRTFLPRDAMLARY